MAGYLDFGPGHSVRHIECPIDQEKFDRFEAEFRPFIEARGAVYQRIPGGSSWSSFKPSREKVLEYYVTLDAVPLRGWSVYLDGASCLSLFPQYVAEATGARVLRQDLHYTPGMHDIAFPRVVPHQAPLWPQNGKVTVTCIGCDACALPLPAASVDVITLHCSFEHFEGDGDRRFVREALRVLRPGGRLLIVPFYCGDAYREVVRPHFAAGCRFQRYYDPPSFVERVLSGLEVPVTLEARYYRNYAEIDREFYCCYSLTLIRE